ncbi:MAG: hypothetical protein LBP63_10820 [Prevotellaceae bacterium]|jgi:hypothetical protein|nr:hypothetical protein [Prevotellaceae bacterium]
MIINKVDYNEEAAKSMSEKEFVKTLFNAVLRCLPEAERKEKLSFAWKVLNGKIKTDKGEKPKVSEPEPEDEKSDV